MVARRLGAGDLRERVTLQRATATVDGFGGETLTWTGVATVWARVIERGGREPQIADRPVMVVGYEVVIRRGVTVTHLDRLTWNGKTLQVETVTPLPVGYVTLRCLEVSP